MAATLLLSVITGFGWRYGFSALPEPVAGFAGNEMASEPAPEQSTSNFWYRLRALQPVLAARRDAFLRNAFLSTARTPDKDPDDATRSALSSLMAATDLRPPATLGMAEVETFREARLVSLLIHAEGSGAAGEAETQSRLEHFLASWRMEAALVPPSEFSTFYDERGVREVFDELAKPMQEAILQANHIDPACAAGWLREFERIARTVPSVEVAFRRRVSEDREFRRAQRRADWRGVRRSFEMGVVLMVQDGLQLVREVLETLVGRRWGGEPSYHGAVHLVRPLGLLQDAAQAGAARSRDFEKLEAASVSRTLELLQSGTLPPRDAGPAWLPGNRLRRNWWQRMWDRPAVWRSLELLPDPYRMQESRQLWMQYLESCRVTLALRLFRDRTGSWPERLEELVPSVLASLSPASDSAGRAPLVYEREGAGWRLRAADGTVLAEARGEAMPGGR